MDEDTTKETEVRVPGASICGESYLEPASQELTGPPVGTITSGTVYWDEQTFAPLTNAELKNWGL